MSATPYELLPDTLRRLWTAAGGRVEKLYIVDEAIAVPTRTDIARIGETLHSILDQLGFEYAPEMQDCDNFAIGAAWWAGVFNARNQRLRSGMRSGFGLGFLFVPSIEHALCIAPHRNGAGEDLILQPYEPQPTGSPAMRSLRPRTLTRADYKSCFLCVFF